MGVFLLFQRLLTDICILDVSLPYGVGMASGVSHRQSVLPSVNVSRRGVVRSGRVAAVAVMVVWL